MAKQLLENETYLRVMSTCKFISLFIYIMISMRDHITCSFYPETTLGQNWFSKGEGRRKVKISFCERHVQRTGL